MPRGVFLLGLGLLLVAVAFVVTCAALGPAPGVTEGNVRRVHAGMTVGEVEAVLGGPGRLRFVSRSRHGPNDWDPRGQPPVRTRAVWLRSGIGTMAHVVFQDGRVVSASFTRQPAPSPLKHLRDALNP